MKNIQVIDGAMNATYDVFQATEEEFACIFPGDTDVEFVDDFIARVGEDVAGRTLEPIWSRRISKKTINGIHGTLFYDLEYKKKYYPTKKDSD
jgi:hypothetical protein